MLSFAFAIVFTKNKTICHLMTDIIIFFSKMFYYDVNYLSVHNKSFVVVLRMIWSVEFEKFNLWKYLFLY